MKNIVVTHMLRINYELGVPCGDIISWLHGDCNLWEKQREVEKYRALCSAHLEDQIATKEHNRHVWRQLAQAREGGERTGKFSSWRESLEREKLADIYAWTKPMTMNLAEVCFVRNVSVWALLTLEKPLGIPGMWSELGCACYRKGSFQWSPQGQIIWLGWLFIMQVQWFVQWPLGLMLMFVSSFLSLTLRSRICPSVECVSESKSEHAFSMKLLVVNLSDGVLSFNPNSSPLRYRLWVIIIIEKEEL